MSERAEKDGDEGWLERSLKSAAAEVAAWRVISDPAVRPTEAGHGIETTLRVLYAMTLDERVRVFDALRGAFCLHCGGDRRFRACCHCENDE